MSQPDSILEIKHKLNGSRHEFNCQTLEKAPGEVVMLYILEKPVSIADIDFAAGTLSLGYFWDNRNYNVYHWVSPQGESLAAYVNIADRTEISPDIVEWRDLIIDLLITPDGRCQVLDEDELPDDLPSALDQLISQQTESLLQQHQQLLSDIELRTQSYLQGLLGE